VKNDTKEYYAKGSMIGIVRTQPHSPRYNRVGDSSGVADNVYESLLSCAPCVVDGVPSCSRLGAWWLICPEIVNNMIGLPIRKSSERALPIKVPS
jgi:hypothetical protein